MQSVQKMPDLQRLEVVLAACLSGVGTVSGKLELAKAAALPH